MIHVQNLSKKFSDFIAVDNISFSVAKGEIFAFLGPNGAGKSTTIKMLTTLLHPTSGTMMLNGHDPLREADAVRHSFGIVFQDQSLDDELTAWENMEFHGVLYNVPKKIRRERIDQLLHFVDLFDRKYFYRVLRLDHFLIVPRRPAQEHQIIDDRLRQEAFLLIIAHRGRSGAFGQARPVHPHNKRKMREFRLFKTQRLIDHDLLRGIGNMVFTADNTGDLR